MPCGDCASITAKTGWPYYQFIRNGTDRWQTRLAPSLPLDQWRLSLVPSLPAHIPLLFLYGTCNIGTGCKGCPPCTKRLLLLRPRLGRVPQQRRQAARRGERQQSGERRRCGPLDPVPRRGADERRDRGLAARAVSGMRHGKFW